MRADAILALTTLGFTKAQSRSAVNASIDQQHPRDLDALLRAALRRLKTC
jgi:Holliday junction resolvasome RuvABC DNA-binding subunit